MSRCVSRASVRVGSLLEEQSGRVLEEAAHHHPHTHQSLTWMRCIQSEEHHSTLLCCRKRMRRCAGAACALTIARMSSGVVSASPLRACAGGGAAANTRERSKQAWAGQAAAIQAQATAQFESCFKPQQRPSTNLQNEARRVHDGQVGAVGKLGAHDDGLQSGRGERKRECGCEWARRAPECPLLSGCPSTQQQHGARTLALTVAPSLRRCASVRSRMASAMAASGTTCGRSGGRQATGAATQ